MQNKKYFIVWFCVVFFCTGSAYAQTDTCTYWHSFKYGQQSTPQDYKNQYDTLRKYIENCAAKDDKSWDVFGTMTAAVQFMNNNTSRYDRYREWLISVLYLNTTSPGYFCACLGAIENTFVYGKYRGIGAIDVEYYIKNFHHDCFGFGGDKNFTKDSADFVNHGNKFSDLPPLDSLGLGFLLKSGVSSPPLSLSSPYLASFTSSPNPFVKETTLQFTLNRMAYTTVSIYDELGKLVWGDGRGASLEAGVHTIHIDASSFPSGTLYARISTGFGEVMTVKLVKQ